MSYDDSQQEDQQFDNIDELSHNIALFEGSLKTMQRNNWALNTYRRWSSSFNSDAVHGIPVDFKKLHITKLNYVLARFFQEAEDTAN